MQRIAPKAIIFDMDGLMVDTEPIYKDALQNSARSFGYELDDAFYFTLTGRPHNVIREMIHEHLGNSFPIDEFWSYWPGVFTSRIETYGLHQKPGLLELLSYIKQHNLPAAVATSSNRSQAEFCLSAAEISFPFSTIVTGDQITNGKPAPDIYLKAARELNISPRHAIALEDSDNGIKAAYHAGMTPIMIPDMKQPGDEVKEIAHAVLPNLNEARTFIARQFASVSN